MTPEGKIKKDVTRILKAFGVHYDMPVNYGYGKKGVDYHCAVRSPVGAIAFYVEVKRPGEEMTALQSAFMRDRREQQNAKTFEIDGMEGIRKLTEFLERIEAMNGEYTYAENEAARRNGF